MLIGSHFARVGRSGDEGGPGYVHLLPPGSGSAVAAWFHGVRDVGGPPLPETGTRRGVVPGTGSTVRCLHHPTAGHGISATVTRCADHVAISATVGQGASTTPTASTSLRGSEQLSWGRVRSSDAGGGVPRPYDPRTVRSTPRRRCSAAVEAAETGALRDGARLHPRAISQRSGGGAHRAGHPSRRNRADDAEAGAWWSLQPFRDDDTQSQSR